MENSGYNVTVPALPQNSKKEKENFKYNIYLNKDKEIKLNAITSYHKSVNLTKHLKQEMLNEIIAECIDNKFKEISDKLNS
jgi:hypothetical protein